MILTAAVCLTGAAFGQQKLDVQGHRGGMGLMPENTIAAMLNGVKLGVKTLELDVVISSDGKVVVSHDPYMSADFMLKPDGSEITKKEQAGIALFQMSYDSISHFDAGLKPHPMFPQQVKMKTHKPLLSELIDSVENYVKKNQLKPVYYNIETKISPAGDGVYNPSPEVFVTTLMKVLNPKNINNRITIQSFDVRTLQILHKTEPKLKLSLLAFGKMDLSSELKKAGLDKENQEKVKQAILAYGKGGIDEDLKKLGFTPDIYSPHFSSVDAGMVKKAHENKMLILPWTVDEEKDMVELGKLGVDGIISNYPDRLIRLFGSYQTK
ncbi:glycerophosphodiester phosphodiesterase family protein [Pedobacter antarcticus]|nr:glycerophosphodiester phosphodiesterase family protein [Pedobacter antarcticus]SDM68232.1 glycerophosphoryl diester phosphodiesterase [Pedobacter antarcticus]SFF39751.1 glycerophosphoryl diester phosphodiesterase [Pedobacter antarcticus]